MDIFGSRLTCQRRQSKGKSLSLKVISYNQTWFRRLTNCLLLSMMVMALQVAAIAYLHLRGLHERPVLTPGQPRPRTAYTCLPGDLTPDFPAVTRHVTRHGEVLSCVHLSETLQSTITKTIFNQICQGEDFSDSYQQPTASNLGTTTRVANIGTPLLIPADGRYVVTSALTFANRKVLERTPTTIVHAVVRGSNPSQPLMMAKFSVASDVTGSRGQLSTLTAVLNLRTDDLLEVRISDAGCTCVGCNRTYLRVLKL